MKHFDAQSCLRDGRDELNLADFPISALQRAQKGDGNGGKLDRLEFSATRYDPVSRGRVAQKVTLTSTARDGLPTPADEHVILALLHVAKHTNDFTDVTVHFAPSQLFAIMGWAPNGRSYTRLRDVLRRLKSLTIRYENAWWDRAGREYEEELATGIISGYKIARQVSGPRTGSTELQSWVSWTQQFYESLKSGNLKKLDLETFFSLKTPTAQRMYRFLDKRFYNSETVSMDLVEFACGHVGLAEVDNIAIVKRRLGSAIEELESIGFIEKADSSERYRKEKVGQWRVTFRRGRKGVPSEPVLERGESFPALDVSSERAAPVEAEATPREQKPRAAKEPRTKEPPTNEAVSSPALDLAREYYRLWDADVPLAPGPRDLEQASLLLASRGLEEAKAILAVLVRVTRKQWPDCRSFSGAVQKYLGDALKLHQAEARRAEERREAEQRREQSRQEKPSENPLQTRWDALSQEQRDEIEGRVRERLGSVPAAFLRGLCLQELGRLDR